MAQAGEGATDFRILRTKPVREKMLQAALPQRFVVPSSAWDDVLVSMHDLDLPMIAIDAQQSLWRGGGGQAGDEIDDLVSRLLPRAVLLDLARTYDAADLPDRRPLALNPGGFGRQHAGRAPFDAPMRLFDAAIP